MTTAGIIFIVALCLTQIVLMYLLVSAWDDRNWYKQQWFICADAMFKERNLRESIQKQLNEASGKDMKLGEQFDSEC